MSRIKDYILDVCEAYQSGMTINQIAKFYRISTDDVEDILKRYCESYCEDETY